MKTFKEFITESTFAITKHGDYSITRSKASADSEGTPEHVIARKSSLNKIGILHHTTPGKYGRTHLFTVRNTKTGDTTHHHVYQSDYDEHKRKPYMSVRDSGEPRSSQADHHQVIKDFLSGKRPVKSKEL